MVYCMYFWGVFSHQAPEKRAPVCSLPSKKRKKVGCWVKHLAVPGFLAFCRGTGIGCLKGGSSRGLWRWAGPGLLAKVPRGGSAGTALPGSQNRPLLKLEHVVLAHQGRSDLEQVVFKEAAPWLKKADVFFLLICNIVSVCLCIAE